MVRLVRLGGRAQRLGRLGGGAVRLDRLGGQAPWLSRQFFKIVHSTFKQISPYFDLLGARKAHKMGPKKVCREFLRDPRESLIFSELFRIFTFLTPGGGRWGPSEH